LSPHVIVHLPFSGCVFISPDNCGPADGTGQYTINHQPLSTPCSTLDDAVAHLAGGPGGSQRHPDVRVRPAGAPLRVEAHLGAAGASTQPGGDDGGDTNAVLASFASYDDATVV